MSDYINRNNVVNKLQALYRGHKTRIKLKSMDDSVDYDFLNEMIDAHIITINNQKRMNERLTIKKIRLSNLPSHITENIAKLAIYKKYNIMPCWDTAKGDIVFDKMGLFKQLEVKGFSSDAPSSFGPKEMWDRIYFVDGIELLSKCFKVYEIKLSNSSNRWKNFRMNENETYHQQCLQKRRPRISFNKIKEILGEECKLIFNGHISNLNEFV